MGFIGIKCKQVKELKSINGKLIRMFVVLFIIEELYEKERQDKINKKKDRLIDKQKEEIFEM